MLTRAAIGLIRFYQRYLSPLKRAPCCRFMPTCSSYALEAIQLRGLLVGLLMASWRILRCNPLFPGGYDPPGGVRDHALAADAAAAGAAETTDPSADPTPAETRESTREPGSGAFADRDATSAITAQGCDCGAREPGAGRWSVAQGLES